MSTSGIKRPLRQSKSLPLKRGCNVDEALSAGFDQSRASALFFQTCPPLKDESSDYKKLYEDLQKEKEKEKEDLHKKHKKEIKDLHKKYKKEIEDLRTKYKKEIEDLRTKYKKEIEDLRTKYKKEIEDLQSADANLESKAELREIFRKFRSVHRLAELNVGLMKKARENNPKDFPFDYYAFSETVAALVNKKANKSTKYKLDLLQDVAKDFRSNSFPWWDTAMGEQFFILCKSVPQWNSDDFHPTIDKEKWHECKGKAEKGMYSIDGVDLKKLVVRLLCTFFW